MWDEKLVEPIQVKNPADFPRSEEAPEGCIVLEDLKDEFGYQVDFHEVVYVKRRMGDGKEKELSLHIYQPHDPEDEERKWPIVVFIQGSAFHKQNLFGHFGELVRLAEKGYVVAAAEYRPSEEAPFPAQMQDCKTAVRYMKKYAGHYHGDPERVALWGDSSGGHTVLMAGFTGDREPDTDVYREYSAEVKCIIDWYGPTEFSKMNCYPSSQDHCSPDSPEGYEIGRKNVLENPDLVKETVPMNYLSKEIASPPLMILHGGRDMLVPFNQSCRLYNRMKELGKKVVFYKLKDANHGILGFRCEKALELVDQFLKEWL